MNGKDVELEHGMFNFGVGPRVCLGREIAMMETYKLISEVSSLIPFALRTFKIGGLGGYLVE